VEAAGGSSAAKERKGKMKRKKFGLLGMVLVCDAAAYAETITVQ
jgi:hypothetical protein